MLGDLCCWLPDRKLAVTVFASRRSCHGAQGSRRGYPLSSANQPRGLNFLRICSKADKPKHMALVAATYKLLALLNAVDASQAYWQTAPSRMLQTGLPAQWLSRPGTRLGVQEIL